MSGLFSLKHILFEAEAVPNDGGNPLEVIKKIATENSISLEDRAKRIHDTLLAIDSDPKYGSNRSTFKLPDGKRVIKVAFSTDPVYGVEEAVSQNGAEKKMCQIAKVSELIPEVYGFGPNDLYLIVERVTPAENEPEKIAKHFGFASFDEFDNALMVAAENREKTTEIKEIGGNKDFKIALAAMIQCNYQIADMTNPANWGFDAEGRPVMLDAGMTRENRGQIAKAQSARLAQKQTVDREAKTGGKPVPQQIKTAPARPARIQQPGQFSTKPAKPTKM
jgi:hypothetical protein